METEKAPVVAQWNQFKIVLGLKAGVGTDGTYPPRWWSLETGVTVSVPGNWGQHGGSAG